MVSRRSTSATCRQRHNRYTARLSTKPVQIKIEHRLFSFITMNWRAKPLTTYRTVVELIAATTTKTGLRIEADLDQGYYPTGQKISEANFKALPVTGHEFHGEWNYTIRPP